MGFVRLVFLADSHLGIDQPANPRVCRRRRGDNFMANYQRVLDYARSSNCDAVVHGGDVFFRSRVRPELVQAAFTPLKRLADEGMPVFVVPGNHERSRIPHAMLATHPSIHIFDRPRTYTTTLNDVRLALTGFPYARSVRRVFPSVLTQTNWNRTSADIRLLCVHHCFEGATVGPAGYTFRSAEDVIRHDDVPRSFAAALSGHIHRHQILWRDLRGRPLATPVFYSGSIERTSFAESAEPKGFLELTLRPADGMRHSVTPTFHPLPTRPMVTQTIQGQGGAKHLRRTLECVLAAAPHDAILRLRVTGKITDDNTRMLSASNLRAMARPTMNVEVQPARIRATQDANLGYADPHTVDILQMEPDINVP